MLGASGWQTFCRVTLPNIKWGLLYGVILCNARAMGEFGAVSVVSGHIRGQTNTMPLHVEILYNEYNFAAAFAVASLLALLALVTLVRQERSWSGSGASGVARAPATGGVADEHRGRATSPRRFGAFAALRRREPRACPTGELVALLGPSGSGKTTLLRIIAGLERPDRGARSCFDGEDATGAHVRERGVGFVFQHYALFRHMTRVRERRLRPARAAARAAAVAGRDPRRACTSCCSWSSSTGSRDRYPSQLSGGQRQRVALARALAVEPKVLLLDEPFGALDAKVRQELRRWLRRLHDEIHVTSVFVTHDQEEALEVADRVVVMNEGRIEQIGTPEEVFDQPATPFVMNFLGNVNLFHGRVEAGRAHLGPLERRRTRSTRSGRRARPQGFARPHELELGRADTEDGFWATLRYVSPAGAVIRLELSDDEGRLVQVESTRSAFEELHPVLGERLRVRPRQVRIFVAPLAAPAEHD